VLLAQQVPPVLLELQVLLAQQVLLVHKVHKVVKEYRERRAQSGFKDQLALQVRPALLGCKVHRELSVLQVFKDRPVLLVPQVRQDRLV
jgi:hypothetical protein